MLGDWKKLWVFQTAEKIHTGRMLSCQTEVLASYLAIKREEENVQEADYILQYNTEMPFNTEQKEGSQGKQQE